MSVALAGFQPAFHILFILNLEAWLEVLVTTNRVSNFASEDNLMELILCPAIPYRQLGDVCESQRSVRPEAVPALEIGVLFPASWFGGSHNGRCNGRSRECEPGGQSKLLPPFQGMDILIFQPIPICVMVGVRGSAACAGQAALAMGGLAYYAHLIFCGERKRQVESFLIGDVTEVCNVSNRPHSTANHGVAVHVQYRWCILLSRTVPAR